MKPSRAEEHGAITFDGGAPADARRAARERSLLHAGWAAPAPPPPAALARRRAARLPPVRPIIERFGEFELLRGVDVTLGSLEGGSRP